MADLPSITITPRRGGYDCEVRAPGGKKGAGVVVRVRGLAPERSRLAGEGKHAPRPAKTLRERLDSPLAAPRDKPRPRDMAAFAQLDRELDEWQAEQAENENKNAIDELGDWRVWGDRGDRRASGEWRRLADVRLGPRKPRDWARDTSPARQQGEDERRARARLERFGQS